MHIVINRKEITNPIAKFVIGLVAMLLFIIFAAVILFVFLPLVGITIVITVFIAVILISSIISIRRLFNRSNKTIRKIESQNPKK